MQATLANPGTHTTTFVEDNAGCDPGTVPGPGSGVEVPTEGQQNGSIRTSFYP
ncbi:MAG: hypothetical protein R6U58_13285 [Bacteroidales bacterium]